MSKLMISVSGVRGVYGNSLTPQSAMIFAAHFGIFTGRGKIVVGRDSRTTGLAMFQAITAGLISVGCDVIDLGVVSTPTILLYVEENEVNGGICITASHNPPEWNAMKFVNCNGMFLFPEVSAEFLKSVDRDAAWSDWQSIGKIYQDDSATDKHITKILGIPYLDVDRIRKRRFKVVVDTVNGAGGLIAPKLLEELGCEVIKINPEPTGIFAHPAEPLNQNLTQLETAVKESRADIGFATDPDVDRLAIVSNEEKCIGEELSVALAEMFVLSKKPGDIVVNLSSSMISEYIAQQHNVQVFRTKVGEINVAKKMLEINSPIGGEGNGGIICPDVHYTRDALAGMALILGLLAEKDMKLSQLVSTLPKYYIYKDKIETVSSKIDDIMNNAYYAFEGLEMDSQDGIKAVGENFWVHIRRSGTEPIIRVYVESDNLIKSKDICKRTIAKIS
jgi:phosphomannomutase